MNKKKYYFVYSVLFVIPLVIFIVGLFFDLNYAKAIYNKNAFGIFFAAIGETPAYGGLTFVAGGLYSYQKGVHKKLNKIILLLVSTILLVVGTFLSMRAMKSYNALNIPSKWYLTLPIAILLDGGLCLLGYDLTNKTNNKDILRVLIFMSAVIITQLLVITILKKVWGRPRYRFLISENGSLDYYRNWWEINSGVKELFPNISSDNFKSCPSGHTASASCAFLIVLLPRFNEKLKGKEIILMIIATIWALVVGLSRHMMGAHFLTDTSFAMMIVMIIFGVMYLIFFATKKVENKVIE